MSTVASAARVSNSKLERKIMTAQTAASLIQSGDQIGMSGFTGSGYPKAVPIELAHRIADAHFRGEKFQVSVFTGASTGPETRRSTRDGRRNPSAAAVSIGSRNTQADQCRRDGLHGHPSEPCG